jgi:hypothetical protein
MRWGYESPQLVQLTQQTRPANQVLTPVTGNPVTNVCEEVMPPNVLDVASPAALVQQVIG